MTDPGFPRRAAGAPTAREKPIITARKRSFGQDNIITGVCLSNGGVSVLGGLPESHPLDRTPPLPVLQRAGGKHPTGMHSCLVNYVTYPMMHLMLPPCQNITFPKPSNICLVLHIEWRHNRSQFRAPPMPAHSGGEHLGCHAGLQVVGRCCNRGEYQGTCIKQFSDVISTRLLARSNLI